MISAMQGALWEDVRAVVEPQVNAEGVHVWPFNPACPVDVRFFQFRKRNYVRLRRHDYFEVLYMHSGHMDCQIHSRSMTLDPGDLMVMNSMLYHSTNPVRPAPMPKAVVLYFEPEIIATAESDGSGPEYLAPFLKQGSEFPHIVPAATGLPKQIADWMERIHAELPVTSSRGRLAVKTYLRMILLALVNHYASWRGTAETFSRHQRLLERLRPLFVHLEGHYHDEISLAEAARLAGMSRPHFMSVFKEATGSSFKHYLNSFRISKAQQLLVRTDRPIAEIAVDVGFCDQSYFGLLFRRHVKMTPLQYRTRALGGETPRLAVSGYAP
jgi:AraC-like DNA-binding protein